MSYYGPLAQQALELLAKLHAAHLADRSSKRLDRLVTKAQRRSIRRNRKGI